MRRLVPDSGRCPDQQGNTVRSRGSTRCCKSARTSQKACRNEITASPRDDGSSIVKKTILALLLLFPWGSTYSALQAQEMADTLRQSSVTAAAARPVTPVSTLSGETLRRLSSQSIADAIRYFSGVQIKDYGGIGGLKTVNVRSLGAQHVGVFYDGIAITNAQNGQVDLGRYSLEVMEAVSLYNAQKSEILQSASEYASGATVYLRSRKPSFDAKSSNLTVRMKGGSFGSLNPSARFEKKIGSAAISADGMYLTSRGDYRFRIHNSVEDTTGRRDNGDISAGRAELGLWASPLGGDLQVHAYLYSSERGLPGPVVRRLSEQYAFKDRQWDRNAFLQSSYLKNFRKFSIKASVKASSDYLEYLSDPEANAAAPYIHNTYRQKDMFCSLSGSWYPAGWLSLNAAVDQRWSALDSDAAYVGHVRRSDTRAVIAGTISTGRLTFQASALGTHIIDRKDGSAGTIDLGSPIGRVTPSLSVLWNGIDGLLSLRAFCKSSFRVPTFNDLYYTLVGNARLNPERTRQADFGMDIHSPDSWRLKTSLSADMFHSDVRDKIVAMPAKSQFRWSMVNFGKVSINGLDVRGRLSLDTAKGSIGALLSYDLERAADITDRNSISYRGQIPYTPLHSGSMVLDYVHGTWSGSLSLLATGRRYRSADNVKANELAPWSTTDLRISRTFTFSGQDRLELGMDVGNLFNQHYEVVTRYPMPGISCMLSITYRI